MNCALTYNDYSHLVKEVKIEGSKNINHQIQPSSIDLTLSNECYEIGSSFLSPNNLIRDKLSKMIIDKIDLDKKKVFKKNKTYLCRLNEKLNLDNNIIGLCNPKSSTGRLDIFCRTVLNYSDEYEKIPCNYKGEIFLEITPRSFDIQFGSFDSLNQMRLSFVQNNFIEDDELKKIHDSILEYRKDPASEYQKWVRNGSKTVQNNVTRWHRDIDIEIFSTMKPGDRWKDLPKHYRKKIGYNDESFNDKWKRLPRNSPSHTVVAHLQKDGYMFIHPTQNRTISVREAARLQSFPDSFVFLGGRAHQFRQIGNAVPPPLITSIIESLQIHPKA